MKTENRLGQRVKGVKEKAKMDENGEQNGSACERGERKG